MILNPCLKNREFFESFIIKVIWYFAKNAIQRAIVSKNKDEFFSDGYILRTIGGIMNYQEFALDHGYITRWLVSEVRKQEVHAAPVTIDQEQNVWIGSVGAADHVNPIRKAFLDDIKKNGLEDPIFEDFQPGGSVKFLGSDLKLSYRVPFGDPVIGNSFFYSTPLWISLAAGTIISSPDDRCIKVLCSVKGGMSIYLDGKEEISFRPYERNNQVDKIFTLNLKKGNNELHAIIDEFAERDTECTISLRIVEGAEGLTQILPMGDRDTALIDKVEEAIRTLAFDRNNFTEGVVKMVCANPFKDKPFSVHLKGATEENTFLQLYHECDAVFEGGKNEAILGPVESFPVGFLRFNVTVEVENLVIHTIRTFENFPYSFCDKAANSVKERKTQAWEYLAKYGEQNANRAMALLFTAGDKKEIDTILRRQIDFINRRSDCSDFYLSYFPFMIRNFSDSGLISEEVLQMMKECIINFRYWHDEPGDDAMWFYSENHALMFHVCQLIAGELYPDMIFTNSGMTGVQMQEKALGMLKPWFETFFKCGFTEWNSPPYLPIDALGFASLYAQTQNAEMKENARKALDYIFKLLAITSFDGVFSTTSGRTYLKELFGNHSNCPSFINWIGYGIGNQSHAGKGVVPFMFSDYEPAEENLALHKVEEGKALSWKSTHGYNGYADITVYKTASYLLSAANDFEAGRRGFQEDVVHAVFSADEHVFINHPGEFALFGHARPSYWAGSGTLPRVNQYKGFASTFYKLDENHPVDFTHAYFPVKEFEKVLAKGNWYFAQSKKGGLIAIYASNGMTLTTEGPNSDRELISNGRTCLWLMRCSSLYKEGSLEAFADKICKLEVAIDGDEWKFNDPEYGVLAGGFGHTLSVNGVDEVYKGFDPVGQYTFIAE